MVQKERIMKKTYYPRRITALGLSALLASCMVGPDYQKPDTSLPAAWSSPAAKAEADKKTATEQNWWEHFNDPALNQLITKALAGNFDLKIAEARIAEARATRASATSDLIPTVNATAGADRQANRVDFGNAPFNLTKPFNTFQAGFDASWELDLFGGKRREIESDTAELKASEASRDDIRVSLLAEVARTYVDIRQYQAQIQIVEDTIKADQHTLDIAGERVRSGTSPGLDVTQASAQLNQEKSDLPHIQNQLAQAEFSMDVLLGEQPGSTHAVTNAPAPIPVADNALIAATPIDVIANRPDIRVAERKLAAATAEQGIATARLFPDVSLSGFFGLLNPDIGNLLRTGSKSWDLGGNVLWPIFNYGKLSAGIDASNARQKEALLTYQKSIVAALSDVERSLTAYDKEEEHRALLTRTAEDNHHAADIARQRYKEGLSSFVEVLDAERTEYASQSARAASDALASENLIAVYKSLGGGWRK